MARSTHLGNPGMKELTSLALEVARPSGAGYADIRINRYRNQRLSARADHLIGLSDSESFGFGVRALVRAAAGFAASNEGAADELNRAALLAVAAAEADIPGRRE